MNIPQPPPVPPRPGGAEPSAGQGPSVPPVAQPDATTTVQEASASPEFPQMIAFVNEARSHMGLGEICDLPEAQGTLTRDQPLSLALTVSVVKYGDGGPFFALVYDEKKADVFVKMGCSSLTYEAEAWTDPNKKAWEIRLPPFLKEFA